MLLQKEAIKACLRQASLNEPFLTKLRPWGFKLWALSMTLTTLINPIFFINYHYNIHTHILQNKCFMFAPRQQRNDRLLQIINIVLNLFHKWIDQKQLIGDEIPQAAESIYFKQMHLYSSIFQQSHRQLVIYFTNLLW